MAGPFVRRPHGSRAMNTGTQHPDYGSGDTRQPGHTPGSRCFPRAGLPVNDVQDGRMPRRPWMVGSGDRSNAPTSATARQRRTWNGI